MSNSNSYEKRDVNVLKLFLAVFLTASFVVVSPVVLYQYYIRTQEALYFERVLLPVAPDLLETRRQEDQRLTSYGTVSPETQTYHVPIERAMQLMLDEVSADGRSNQ